MTESFEVALHTTSPSSYNRQAAEQFFGEAHGVTYRGENGVDKALDSLVMGESRFAVIAVANTITGRVEDHLRQIVPSVTESGLYIMGHLGLSVEHVLAVLDPGVRVEDLTHTITHPAAAAQTIKSRKLLSEVADRRLEKIAAADTATAAEIVRSTSDRTAAAITSKEAAHANGLHVLQDRFFDGESNTTTFWVLARDHTEDPRADSAVIQLHTGDQDGALVDALVTLKEGSVGMADIDHIQSNGTKNFVIELKGGAHEEKIRRVIDKMRDHRVSKGVDILGSMRQRY